MFLRSRMMEVYRLSSNGVMSVFDSLIQPEKKLRHRAPLRQSHQRIHPSKACLSHNQQQKPNYTQQTTSLPSTSLNTYTVSSIFPVPVPQTLQTNHPSSPPNPKVTNNPTPNSSARTHQSNKALPAPQKCPHQTKAASPPRPRTSHTSNPARPPSPTTRAPLLRSTTPRMPPSTS